MWKSHQAIGVDVVDIVDDVDGCDDGGDADVDVVGTGVGNEIVEVMSGGTQML